MCVRVWVCVCVRGMFCLTEVNNRMCGRITVGPPVFTLDPQEYWEMEKKTSETIKG